MNKKAAIIDIVVFVIFSFIVLLVFAIYFYGHGLITDNLVALTNPIGTQGDTIGSAAESTFGLVNDGLQVLKILAFAIMFSMMLSIFVSNALMKVHPMFFVAYLMFTMLAVILSAYLSNAYQELMIGGHAFSSTLVSFKAGSFIMVNFPIWTTIVGIFGMILLFINVVRESDFGESPI